MVVHLKAFIDRRHTTIIQFLLLMAPLLAVSFPQNLPAIFAGVVFVSITQPKKFPVFDIGSTLFVVFMFGFLSFSVFWANSPLLTLQLLLKLLFIGVGAFCIFCCFRKRTDDPLSFLVIGHLLACSFLIANAVFGDLIQTMRHISTAKAFSQGGIFLSLSFWACLWKMLSLQGSMRVFSCLALTILTGTALHFVGCDTPLIGLILSFGMGFLFCKVYSKVLVEITCKLIVLAFLTTPWICYYAFKPDYLVSYNYYIKDPSYLHRMLIWYNTSQKIIAHPFLGYGLGASRIFTGDYTELCFEDKNCQKTSVRAESMGIHPHNIALQLWLELGVLGGLLGGMLAAWFFRYCALYSDPRKRFCMVGFWTTTMLTFWVSVGAFQTWWLVSLFLILAFFQFGSIQNSEGKSNAKV